MTLKQKLIGATLLAVISMAVVMSAVIGVNYYDFGRSNIYSKTESSASLIGDNITTWLNDRQRILSALKDSHSGVPSLNALIQARESGGFYDVYFGTARGDMFISLDDELPEGYDPRQRDWYIDAVNKRGEIISESYQDATTLETTITLAQPVYESGQLLGVLAADIVIDSLIKDIASHQLGNNTHTILFEDTRILAHRNSQLLQQPMQRIHPDMSPSFINKAIQEDRIQVLELNNNKPMFSFYRVPGTDWTLAIEMDFDTEISTGYSSFKSVVFAGIVVIVLVVGLVSLLINYLFRDLNNVSAALQTIASGEGDLTQRLEPRNDDEVGQLAHNFNLFVSHMHGMVLRMREIAEQLSAQSDQTAAQAQQRSVGICQQQQEIASVATAIDQMATATHEVASHAEETARTSQHSVSLSSNGAQQVKQSQASTTELASEVEMATEVINALDEHTKSINTILATIQGVAEQTNLLALNAAIEAARAGTQGRGFAVVADEVRVLSQRTHDSTAEIQTTIETLQRVTQEAVALMTDSRKLADTSVSDANQAAASLGKITDAINEISDMATQIASAAEEQSLVTREITRNTQSIRQVADDMADEAGEAAAQANSLSSLAHQLQGEVEKFKV
ncbi:methyl-accepting chemotaxis protein [Thaumasiovibrio sp. DFM-14]|uniref:methyl-accepting chemotaxis protein n=1 Tax=Thaumasiovibrio sp. DFM-14 TaxID=3384792 RepID=UPI0039A12CBF